MSRQSIKRGAVVEHNESKVRYAVSEDNYNPKIHTLIRPLRAGETVRGYKPRAKAAAEKPAEDTPAIPVPKPNQSATAAK